MKKLLAAAFFCIVFSAVAQTTTLVFQGDPACGTDALITTRSPDFPYPAHHDILISAWTYGGVPMTIRGLLDFDLSGIPPGATVTQATLELFHHISINNNPGHSTLSGANDATIYRVTQNWAENTVTWNTQPNYSLLHSVFLPASVTGTENYTIDVKDMVQDMVNDPGHSFGFMIRLNNESYYRSLLFASSDDVNPALRPKLTVVVSDTLNIGNPCIVVTVVPPPVPPPTNPGNPGTGPNPGPDTTVVTANPLPVISLSIPNVFSPDNDGKNDVYFIGQEGFNSYEMKIYNRWGMLIKTLDLQHPAWDGKNSNGLSCPDGTYFYSVTLQPSTGGNAYQRNGYILLTRGQ